MADEHFFPGPGDFPYVLGAAPFVGSPYAPPGLDGVDAAALQGFGGMAWADLQLPDSSAATAHFDSALSSLVSSPAHNGYAGDDVAIGDLIGRLGSICNAATAAPAASASNSCYSTPLSSPTPRRSSPASAAAAAMAFRGGCYGYPGSGAAAGLQAGGRLSRVASSKSLGAGAATPAALGSPEAGTSPTTAAAAAVMRDDDPAPPPPAKGSGAARKRKASGKGKATSAATTAAPAANAASPKRSKLAVDGGGEGEGDGAGTAAAAAAPEPEPAKDYIHVRARRGQATDSHSLAERVRRERISERMKLLQSLVPGCNKITGKALMLDEIINYVQSLQRQVEFLSMKLATMNPEMDAETRYQTAAAMVASSAPAAFSPYAAALPSHLLVDSCAAAGAWEAQDLQSVVARHNNVAVHRPDLYASPSPSPPAQSSFHGQQGAAAGSHMKLEQQP